jgi:hypothetical protein
MLDSFTSCVIQLVCSSAQSRISFVESGRLAADENFNAGAEELIKTVEVDAELISYTAV